MWLQVKRRSETCGHMSSETKCMDQTAHGREHVDFGTVKTKHVAAMAVRGFRGLTNYTQHTSTLSPRERLRPLEVGRSMLRGYLEDALHLEIEFEPPRDATSLPSYAKRSDVVDTTVSGQFFQLETY